MKKITATLFSLLCVFFGAQSLFALPLTGNEVKIFSGEYRASGYNGGEFRVVEQSTQEEWIGFCLELNESLSFGSTYKIKSVEDYAENGGVDGASHNFKDYLSDKSKWLYYNYVFGNYDWSRGEGSNLSENRALNANFQNVLWFLEGELSSLSGSALTLYDSVVKDRNDFTFSGTVKVLNIGTEDRNGNWTYNQSLIVGEPVPEPATLLLMGTGLMGIVGMARRRKSQLQKL